MQPHEVYLKLSKLMARRYQLESELVALDEEISRLHWRLEDAASEGCEGSGVYIVQCHGFYKIGYASDIEYRLREIQIGTPYDLHVAIFFSCPIDEARRLEKELHKRFENKNKRGEWFKLTYDDIRQLQELKVSLNQAELLSNISELNGWATPSALSPRLRASIRIILNAIHDIGRTNSGVVPKEEVLKIASKNYIDRDLAERIIRHMMQDGDIMEPKHGFLKLV